MNTGNSALGTLSDELAALIARATTGIVAIKGNGHRTVSGIVLRHNLIATTEGVLRREAQVTVYAADGSREAATILGRDPRLPIAFLRAEGLSFTPLEQRDHADLKAGMLAAVVGLTMDAGPSASIGILGAVGGPRRIWRGGTLDHFIKLDVNVYPSQTGGAVVDSAGKLIGIAIPGLLQYSAVAIPVVSLNRITDELLAQGRIRQGYLGVGLQQVALPAALREKLADEQQSGLIVLNVESGSPAEKGGVQLGDILISFDKKSLAEVDDLQAALQAESVGRSLQVTLIRGGERQEVQLTVSERAGRSR